MSAERQSQTHHPPAKPRNGRARTIAIVGLIEVALLAIIGVALAGTRIAATAEWLDAVPGGRWAVAGVALILLLAAAFAMTLLLSA